MSCFFCLTQVKFVTPATQTNILGKPYFDYSGRTKRKSSIELAFDLKKMKNVVNWQLKIEPREVK